MIETNCSSYLSKLGQQKQFFSLSPFPPSLDLRSLFAGNLLRNYVLPLQLLIPPAAPAARGTGSPEALFPKKKVTTLLIIAMV